MGCLESGEKRCLLSADQVIGREPGAALRLDDDSVSWRHASVRWTGHAWELQDLGSRNGTFVDGHRIAAGARALLRMGCQLRFGDAEELWRLVDVEPPVTALVDLATGERFFAFDELLAAPHSGEPELFISRQADGSWIAEFADRVWEPAPSEVLTIGARQYRFEPGAPVYATTTGRGQRLTPAEMALQFLVTRNEEHVEVKIVHGDRSIELRPRAHSYVLLTLARLRVRDQEDESLAPSNQGWVYQDHLLKMLATTPTQLAVDIYRARKQFSEAGVTEAAQIVERRGTTHELRIGVPRLAITVA
ncbi:MAG TPA: FHA domain-containing protein [Polyangiaceae bacterium]|nr:FHA domain-containing protein [Polyangiaceae bacterium]